MAAPTSRVTSQARSNRRARGLALAAGAVVLAAGGCARHVDSAIQASPGGSAVGYVRMGDLVKKHPLFAQLSRFDEDIAALQLKSAGGNEVAHVGADIQREDAALQHELDAAAHRTQTLLKQKQNEYQRREDDAIKAVLAAAGVASGPSTSTIAGQMQATANDQARAVAREAQTNLDRFRRETIVQDKAAVDALSKSLGERADRTFRAKSEELHEREAAFALSQANADAAERLSLRTKLSNLPLDDAGRKEITDRLEALDRKEADALAAMRNRDQATLAALQVQLRAQTRTDFQREAGAIHGRTNAKLADRARQTQSAVMQQLGGAIGTTQVSAGGGAASLTPETRAQLLALHKKYQADFQRDADQTVKEFYRTKGDLSRRFAELHGVDLNAQNDARKQLAALQKQRDELYDSIVAQIGREVKLVAQKHAVGVVFSDIVAPVGSVDLTADAEKDIESLHE
jgi:hypothetical protein